jgi:outer membrane immunogenic protein
VGWVVVPQLLTYFTGGYTEAKFDSVNFTSKLNTLGGSIGSVTGLNLPSQTYQGWFLGGGTEYALGWLPGLFLKTEYRYSTYNSKTIGLNCTGLSAVGPAASCLTAGPSGFSDRYKPQVQTIFSELVYRFNWGAARY